MKVVVGQGSCGISVGADKTKDEFVKLIGEKGLDVKVGITGCIGSCYLEPIVDIYDDEGKLTRYVKVQPENVLEIFENHILKGKVCEKFLIEKDDEEFIGKQTRIVLRNTGIIDPEDINDYIGKNGYKAAKKAVTSMSQEDIIEEVKVAGLRGRGGAGFPTWKKWTRAKAERGEKKYIVCNADEGDPGVFMDRSVLESDPHSVIEGMIIGGFAIGATEGIIYCRGEYVMAVKRLQMAIDQAREKGFLGNNIFGTGFSFDLRINVGVGAFVCGEETALIATLEGERGMPRIKPNYPVARGYWQQPTNVNNVETYANVAWIVLNGGAAYSAYGRDESRGTKVFALSGKIKKGGLVELPLGMTLREVVYDIGGGIQDDKALKAVQMGGPSGGCVPAELIDLPITHENIENTGAMIGSGDMIIVDEDRCMVDMARFFIDFARKESCGKCNYCRIGTKRLLEILERIIDGKGKEGDIELLEELSVKVKDGSLCGLGKTAPNPLLTTIKYFRNEYEDHIINKKCTAKACKKLISYHITDDCKGCTLCSRNCPVKAITGSPKELHVIDQDVCIKCGKCFENCRFNAIEIM